MMIIYGAYLSIYIGLQHFTAMISSHHQGTSRAAGGLSEADRPFWTLEPRGCKAGCPVDTPETMGENPMEKSPVFNTQSAKKWGILPPATCFTDLDRFCSFEHTQINSNITRELPCCYFFILWTKITQVFLYHLKSLVLLAENPNCPSGPSGCYFLGGLGGVYMENFITAAPQRVLLLPAAGTGLLGLMPCKQVLMEYHQVRWKLRWVKQQAWW